LDVTPKVVNKFEAVAILMFSHPKLFAPVILTTGFYIGKALIKIGVSLILN